MRIIKLLITFLLIGFSSAVIAGGVKGVLKSNSGEILPFASIYVHQLKSGTSTNIDGYFEIKLQKGVYDIVFQYLGYETITKRVEVKNEYITIEVVLEEKSIQLNTATVYGGKEDPAYTLMRKAIAKAPFHIQELDWYSAEVYLKGSGRVIDAPFFIRKKLAEEGFDSTTAYISETVTEVEFTRPNTYKQNVISTRTSGSDNNSAQNSFVFGSFYQPDIGGLISPLSKKAFAYYKFKYVESFSDRGYTINKIQVIPRSKGEGVVEGFLYLVENDWNIYRINFVTYQEGIKINIHEVYAPIDQKIWLPVNLKFDISGKFFGVKFEYKYLATIGKYKWKINPELDFEVEIIDEKINKEMAEQLEKLDAQMEITDGNPKTAKEEKKVTRKQLKKMLEEYEEKEEDENEEIKNVTSNYEFTIDSLANKKDSTYWDNIRSVPLDSVEINGYQKLDSILVVEKEKEKNDSTKKNTFSPVDLFFGYTFKFNDTNSLRVSVPMSFNTVDGFLLGARLRFNHSLSDSTLFQLFGESHYAFSRTALLWQAKAKFSYGSLLHKGNISVSGGKMDVQFNENEPISPILNTFTSLVMEDNFMKLYQNEFLKVSWNQNVNPKFELDVSAQYSRRSHLENTTDFTFFNYEKRNYTSNIPYNKEFFEGNPNISKSPNSNRYILDLKTSFRPWQKLYVRNGITKLQRNSSPTIWVRYLTARDEWEQGVRLNDVSVGFSHYIKMQGARRLRVNAYLGSRSMVVGNSQEDFIDYVHFMGNESPFVKSNPATQYRMLPYYQKSTVGGYASVFLNYEFKKLALTQFFFLRMTGIKENLFANFLWAENSNTNYYEVGYSLDNLFRVLRIEVVSNNLNGPFNDWAIRFGITTNFANE